MNVNPSPNSSPGSVENAPRVSEETAVEAPKPKRLPWYLNTRTLVSHFFFGPYIFIPLITSFVWFGGLLALMIIWAGTGKPKYAEKEASIVFVSNVAGKHKPVFIPVACVTAVGFVASLVCDRWLRGIDRLPADVRTREKVLNSLAIFSAVIAGISLILLSILDNFNHSSAHWGFAATFIVLAAFATIFQTGQVWSLHKDHPDRKSLLRNSVLKLIILTLGVMGAISFAALYGVCHGNRNARNGHSAKQCNRITSGAAAMEWAIAFILFFFFLTLVADLWPAGKSSPRYMRRLARWQEEHEPTVAHEFTGRGAFTAHPERWEENGAADAAEARAMKMEQAMKARNRGDNPTAPSPAKFPLTAAGAAAMGLNEPLNEPLAEHAAEPGQSAV